MEKNKLEGITDVKCGSCTLSYEIENNIMFKTDNFSINSKMCYLKLKIGWSNTSNAPPNPVIKVDCQIFLIFFENYLYNQNFKVTINPNFLKIGHSPKLKKESDKLFYTNFSYTGIDLIDNSSKIVSIVIHFENVGCQTISNTMNRLLLENTYSDLKIVTKDKEFNVHKNILAVNNEVLSKMIESDMSEKKTSIINFSKWNSTTVENLIDYIYTGKCNIEKNPHELFKLAHFLQIVDLQNLCKNCLKLNVNEENLINSLKLTAYDQYDLKDLDIIIKDFIKKNQSNLSQNVQFIDFLIDSLDLDNITFSLKFASVFKIEKLLSETIKYFHNNSQEALANAEIQRFLKWNPTIMYKLYEYTVHQM